MSGVSAPDYEIWPVRVSLPPECNLEASSSESLSLVFALVTDVMIITSFLEICGRWYAHPIFDSIKL